MLDSHKITNSIYMEHGMWELHGKHSIYKYYLYCVSFISKRYINRSQNGRTSPENCKIYRSCAQMHLVDTKKVTN